MSRAPLQDQPTGRDADGQLSRGHLRQILRLAVPAMLAIANEPFLSIADTAMIGRLGVEPLAARAVGAALIGGIYWVFTFLVFGTTTLVGYHHGANNREACAETYLHAAFFAVIGGLLVAVLGILFAPKLYRLMGAEEDVLRQGISYFRVRVASAPLTFLFYATVGFLRGIQNTRIPMLIAFLASALNLLLDYALIYGNLGMPPLGLYGAAIASAMAQFLGAASAVAVFLCSSDTAPYRPLRWRVRLALLRPLFRIGRDLAARTGALRFSLVFATGAVARMGANILAAHEIAFQLFLLCSDVIDGLAVAGQALVAKHLGAHRSDRAHEMGKVLMLCGGVAGLFFSAAFLELREALIQIFTQSSDVFGIVTGMFLWLALFQPLNGIVFVLDGFLIGAHDTRFLMWSMLVGALGIFVPISWLSLQWDWGLTGVWVGLSLLMVLRFATNAGRFLSRRWVDGRHERA